jgi:alpha-glucosidase
MSSSAWWHGATLYQIYVRSWLDSNGDGYGDLGGVLDGLDYLQWLGVDGIWLSPTMPSPDRDWGYDVSDYLGVHPELGTMEQLDRLIAEAGRRGIRVLLDLVPNHTSDAHPWFADARSARDSAHRSYYVWADPAPGGGPPNNWLDFTGAPAWTFDEATGQYYLHNFLPAQPDLNWWEPRVHEEFRRILGFWFGRGVAGFRVDVAHGLYKDSRLRDNPPLRDGNWRDGAFGLKAVYNVNRPETHAVFRDWRAIAERYTPPRLLLGETWVGRLSQMASYYGDNDELQLAFNFPFVFAGFSAPALAAVVGDTLRSLPAGGCPVWTGSNHDVSRFPSRWCGGDERKARLALLLLATLPGTLVLYYGDEIAMADVAVPPELRRDPMPGHGIAGTGKPGHGRDAARTPMHWDGSATAGFTGSGCTPWLPVGDNAHRNVAAQRANPASTLRLCRDLLALRREHLGGQIASYQQLPAPPGVWAYRVADLAVFANLTGRRASLPELPGPALVTTAPGGQRAGQPAALRPWQPAALEPSQPAALGPWQGVAVQAVSRRAGSPRG